MIDAKREFKKWLEAVFEDKQEIESMGYDLSNLDDLFQVLELVLGWNNIETPTTEDLVKFKEEMKNA
jgi:hypothetical protein